MRTSYSAISTYLQCPQRYKFQDIDRIRAPKSREAIFGTLIHSTLKFMFQKSPLYPTLDEVIAHFRTNWPSEETFKAESMGDPLKRPWTEIEEKMYFNEGVRILKTFYEKNAPWNFHIIDLESRFQISFVDGKTKRTHTIAGIIDRIDKLPDGTYEIIDYKTARRMPSQQAIDEDLQLSLYAWGLRDRWPNHKNEDITLSLYFLKHGEKLTTTASDETDKKTKHHFITTIRDIEDRLETNKAFEPLPTPLCNWCGYRPICPAWRHLYKKAADKKEQSKIEQEIDEYFDLQKDKKAKEVRMKEIQQDIKEFMEQEEVTRVFSEAGHISKNIVQRFEYDVETVKSVLSGLGKWEEVLKTDDAKLKKLLKELPEDAQKKIENSRRIKKEYTTLSASTKNVIPE